MKKYQQEYNTPYQLKFPIEIEKIIETTDPVYTFCEVIDHIDLNKYLTTEERRTGRPRYDEKTLLKVILFAFMENGYESLRKIEKLCKTDIRFMWLLQDEPPPSHMTIDNFMNNVLNGKIEEIFADINAYIFEQENVDMDHVYIDGTKITANANKYSWVWKKSCEKNRVKVFAKITELLSEINKRIAAFGVKFGVREEYAIEYLEQILKQYIQLCGFDPASAVRGRGHHKTPEQRYYDKLTSYIARLKKYAEHIKICGNERNSYSKTDHDATFMRMKEDAMGNGQLKPAYNLQHGVDSEYITWLTIGPQPTDTTTLIPFLKDAEKHLKFKYKNITADAGYESEENYLFLEENGQLSYIKPANYEISKTRKYRNDIGKIENMEYDEESDIYTCRNGKKLTVDHIRHSKSRTGYVSEKTIYRCENCESCPYKKDCIKGNNCKTPLEERTKTLQVAKTFLKYRQEDLERILSDKGILFRTNRSIQAEGSFGDLKQDMQFRRYLSKGTTNVLAESTLLAMAKNINKLHNKIQKGRTGTHLFPLKSA